MRDSRPTLVSAIRDRYEKVLDEISAASRRAGRTENSVRLVVVTKAQPVDVVEAAIEAGATRLGENYAEQAVAKMAALKGLSGSAASRQDGFRRVEWHMIGHIQSRKTKLLVPNFKLIHSLDSLKIAQRLDRLADEAGLRQAALIECNVAGEAGKHGWNAADEREWSRLIEELEPIVLLPNLSILGLMTMPPLPNDPEDSRAHFRSLRRLRDFLASHIPGSKWEELSMGTSVDYAVAVEEGATFVRVGEAILGRRNAEGQW